MKKNILYSLFFFVLFISLLTNALLLQKNKMTGVDEMQKSFEKYPLISKRVFIKNQNDILINFVSLRKEISALTQDNPNVAFYFEYLPSGVSISINSQDNYLLASLLKVPIAMAVYKDIEAGKLTKDQVLTVQETDLDQKFGTFWEKGVGTKVTVDQALDLMLTESDNTAKNVLLKSLSTEKLANVFDYLDIPKESEEAGPVVSPRNYSSIMRSLYLASYLPVQDSNDLLDKLTHAIQTDKMTALLPKGVKVAHKIGVYHADDVVGNSIYTDCGIVYAPNRPYILCMMVRSEDSTASAYMSKASKMVYDYVTTAK